MEKLENCPVCNYEKWEIFLHCRDHFQSGDEFEIVRCKKCSFLFTNPRPDRNEIGKYYESQNYISHHSSGNDLMSIVYRLVRKWNIKKKFIIISTLSNGKNLLDIGCGSGELLQYFNSHGWNTMGIEPNNTARKIAVEQNNVNAFPEGQLEEMPDASFDVISLWHVLEHISDLHKRMAEIRRLIKPGGTIFIAVPNASSYDAKYYNSFWAAFDVPRHLYHFTRETISLLVSNYQFEMIKILPMKMDAFYVSLLSEKYKTGRKNIIKAVTIGLKSNIDSRRKINHSSLIYVLRPAKQILPGLDSPK